MNQDNKYPAAAASAVIMNNVLTSLQIKHEIIVFTEVLADGGVLKHGIIKGFGNRSNTEQVMKNFEDFSREGLSQNLDGESIMWSAERLLRQDSPRKLMIVFSDGAPAAYRRGSAAITRDAIKEIESRKDMEIYGIGIKSSEVRNYYKDHSVIHDTSKLEQALLSVIKTKILN
jgi:cobalamin biosynthesis protein CobT